MASTAVLSVRLCPRATVHTVLLYMLLWPAFIMISCPREVSTSVIAYSRRTRSRSWLAEESKRYCVCSISIVRDRVYFWWLRRLCELRFSALRTPRGATTRHLPLIMASSPHRQSKSINCTPHALLCAPCGVVEKRGRRWTHLSGARQPGRPSRT